MACGGIIAAMAMLSLASTDQIVIGTEAPFPPYTYLDESGAITGIDRDIGDEICTRLMWSCQWQARQFDQLIPGVMAGEYDLVIGGIAVTAEREKLVSFSLPYDKSTDVVEYLGAPGAPPPEAARIAVQSGTIHESFLTSTGRNPTAYPTVPAAIAALIAGKVDLALVPFDADDPALQAAGLSAQYDAILPDYGTALAVCKGNDDLLQPINSALEAMLADGTINVILTRWN